jgi:cell division protein FtsQ
MGSWRRRLLAALVALVALVALYMLWFRDSSLVAIDQVEVKGVTVNRKEVTTALEQAASGMTTLHVRDDELADAVRGFPTIATIRAESSLPHKLVITVTERLPVARARIGGEVVAVSADGYLLAGLEPDRDLPWLDADRRNGPLLGERGAAQAAILGAAPKELRPGLRSATWDDARGGVVVDLAGAPELRFGNGEDAGRKWAAAAAVLGAPGGIERVYVDVSVPERPVSA